MGDRISIESLLKEQAWLKRLATNLVGDKDADDVMQDTLISAWNSPPDEDQPPRPWLAKVALNVVRMNARSSKRRVHREQLYVEATTLDRRPSEHESAETVQLISKCLQGLNEPYRSTLRARYLDEKTSAEISKLHDVPASTVRFRIKRGLEIVRTQLDEMHGGRKHWMFALSPIVSVPKVSAQSAGLFSLFTKVTLSMKKIALVFSLIALGVVSNRMVSANKVAPANEKKVSTLALSSQSMTKINSTSDDSEIETEQKSVAQKRDAMLAKLEKAKTGREQINKKRLKNSSYLAANLGVPLEEAFDKEYIRDQVREILPLVRECYENTVVRRPDFSGTAVVSFSIIADEDIGGLVEVSEYDKEASTLVDDEFEECIQETMYAAEFEAPVNGYGTVHVTYPFTFKMMEGDLPQD